LPIFNHNIFSNDRIQHQVIDVPFRPVDMKVLPDESCALPIGGIDYLLGMTVRSAILTHTLDFEIARRVEKDMEGIVASRKMIRGSAADNYPMPFISSFQENRACEFAHLIAIELLTVDNPALGAASPEQPADTSEKWIGMFIEFFDGLDIDVCHFRDIENE